MRHEPAPSGRLVRFIRRVRAVSIIRQPRRAISRDPRRGASIPLNRRPDCRVSTFPDPSALCIVDYLANAFVAVECETCRSARRTGGAPAAPAPILAMGDAHGLLPLLATR